MEHLKELSRYLKIEKGVGGMTLLHSCKSPFLKEKKPHTQMPGTFNRFFSFEIKIADINKFVFPEIPFSIIGCITKDISLACVRI